MDQPEIGILGFLCRPAGEGFEWLVQAKSEPGTVAWVQVGPSVQATRSNYTRLHGGRDTPYLDNFVNDRLEPTSSNLQSEQGSRFYNKYNVNPVAVIQEEMHPTHPNWCWFPAAALRSSLGRNYTINTDARSVIVTNDWSLLRADYPFFEGTTHLPPRFARLRRELAQSNASAFDEASLKTTIDQTLRDQRARFVIILERVALENLSGWRFGPHGVIPDYADRDGALRYFSIDAIDREVEQWDQPFLTACTTHLSVLALARLDGLLVIGFRCAAEPGFTNYVQLGPSYQSDGHNSPAFAAMIRRNSHRRILEISQSDEGGRFMRIIVQYALYDFGVMSSELHDCNLVWLTVAQLRYVCLNIPCLTNEARTAISLLLSLI